MRIRFFTLTIQCRESREVIPFSPQVTFFHGQTGAGKSSIARMLDVCLGGNLEKTPAVRKEVVSVSLDAQLGDTRVVLERESLDSNQVHVSWSDEQGHEHHLLAPIRPANTPILGDNVYNLSDLIFHFCGVTPIKVRKSKSDEGSPLIRLSFRDIMWYCYLDQDHLDSSFFRLKEPVIEAKSRDVMRFIVGYYTERLQELEIQLEGLVRDRDAKIETTKQMRAFLDRLGYATEQQIRDEVRTAEHELRDAEQKRGAIHNNFQGNTHFVDTLRQQLRTMSDTVDNEQRVRVELEQRLTDQQGLRAELVTARVKLARHESASFVLEGVAFAACPMCGTPVEQSPPDAPEGHCPLCKSDPSTRSQVVEAERNEQAKRDLESRIEELENSIDRAKRSFAKQVERVERLRGEKSALDQRLVADLRDYDSAFVAEVRELDRQIATLRERLRSLERMKTLPDAIEQLSREVDQSRAEEERIRREMESERRGLTTAGEVIGDIEKTYLEVLLRVGVPGVRHNDTVHINRRNWIPVIQEEGDEEVVWSFFDTGSGGKKTLLNVCYALAVHQVAARRSLPLPTFLIIDTPMKNISEDVNRDIFEAFYRCLYEVAASDMAACQMIIIDKEYIAPPENIHIVERFMTPDQPEYPPLISYYRGA
jgi:DNA repair exonuclease SbcCD ATPase subunit